MPNESNETARSLFDERIPALLRMLPPTPEASRARGAEVLHISVAGEDGGEWTIATKAGAPSITRGLHGTPTWRLSLQADEVARLFDGNRDFTALFDKAKGISIRLTPPPLRAVLSPDDVRGQLMLGLTGTFIKIDHKQNQPTHDGAYSFITFNPLLGLRDRVLDIPISEHSPGDFAQWATLASGGWYTIDRIRLLVNNLQGWIGPDTLTVTLENDAIVLDVAFTSNNPTLEAQARAYLVPLFGIPLGWVDAFFPDFHIPDFRIRLRLSPFVDNGKIKLAGIGVEFAGTIQTQSFGDAAKDLVRNGIRNAFATVLDTQEFRDGFASAITHMLEQKFAAPITTWIDVWVDPDGITARGRP